MFSRDFKAWAREALRGHWWTAVAVCFIGGLLAGGIDMVSAVIQQPSEVEVFGMLDLAANDAWPMMVTVTVVSLLVALIIGGAVTLGVALYFTNIVAYRPSKFSDLFARFGIWHKGVWMSLVMSFFVFLWSLLFIIPGIIAVYRYAMVPYLIAEFPDLSVMDAMRESKRLMKGNKWRLFCLGFSFIGWVILVCLTFGIGFFWLEPYMQAANAAFYLDVTGRSGLRYPQPEREL